MEVEEIPPSGEDGFLLVANGAKRKKTDSGTAGDDKIEENLLGKNKFGALKDDKKPKPDKPKPVPTKPIPVVETPGKSAGKEKLPPLVVKNISFASLMEKLNPRPVAKLTRFGIKLLCSSSEEFKAVEAQLKKGGLEYYTHDKPNERPYRVVLRGLPLVNPQDLIHRLKKDHGLAAQSAHIIKRKGECAALEESFYLLHFPKGYTNLQKLREIKAVGNIIVRWEAYRNKRVESQPGLVITRRSGRSNIAADHYPPNHPLT